MIGLKGLQDDINIAHSVHATQLQSDVSIPAVYTVLKHLFCTYYLSFKDLFGRFTDLAHAHSID